jgi:cytochrome c
MKKITLMVSMITVFMACNNSSKSTTDNKEGGQPNQDPQAQKGLDLVASNDCFGCHSVSDRIKGPSYSEVAEKYKGRASIEDSLVQRVQKGSTGVWGQDVMPAHPALADSDAKAMVTYILSLKK